MIQNLKKNDERGQKDQESAKLSRRFLSLKTAIISNGETFKVLNRGQQSDLLLQRLFLVVLCKILIPDAYMV